MSRILTPEELNEVKVLAKSKGFGIAMPISTSSDYTLELSKRYRENKDITVYYDEMNGKAFVSIYWKNDSVNVEDLEKFTKVMSKAQVIAKELNKE